MMYKNLMLKICFLSILIIFIFGFTSLCFAGEIELHTDDEFTVGKDAHIKVKINFQELQEGVYFLQGQLDYDSNIFEKVNEDDITLLNSWHDLVFNSETGAFIIEGDGNYREQVEEIMDIKLKTKKTNRTLTQITLRSIKEIGKKEVETDIPSANIKINISHDKDESLANQILPSTGLIFPLIFIVIFIILLILGIKQYKKIKKQ